MLNDIDIYKHFMKGGSPEDLHKALENEIQNVQDRIIKEKDVELKKKEAEQKELKARAAAFKAIKAYVALVNPTLDDAFIDSALDLCKTFKVITCKEAQSPEWLIDFMRTIF